MQIVIDIPEKVYNTLTHTEFDANLVVDKMRKSIVNGTPFPKGHGRLSDMDELVKKIVKEYGVNSIHELPQDIKMFYDKFINSAPTILDATFDYKLKNYAFVRKEEN